TVNGPTGHLSTFPAAGGLLYLYSVDPDFQDRYAHALAITHESVVVWVPGETAPGAQLKLPRLVQTIRRFYRPEACFENFEVWRHVASRTGNAPAPGLRGGAPSPAQERAEPRRASSPGTAP